MSDEAVANFLDQADSLMDIARPNEALPLLREAARLAPDNSEVLCRFSRAFVGLEDWDSALKYSNLAVIAAPDEEWGHRLCSIALRHLGNPHESLRAAQAACSLDPESAQCVWALARAQIECEQYGLAEESAWRCVEMEPDAAEGHVMLARVFYVQKKWKQAENHARKALEIEPEDAQAMEFLADSVSCGSGKRRALPYYVRVLENNPANTAVQKRVLEHFSNFPYVVVPALLVLFWVVFGHMRMNGLAAFGTALTLSFLSGVMLFKFWPQALLYPQPSFWKLPSAHRDFVSNTWQREWLTRSKNVMVMTGLMLGLIGVLMVGLIVVLAFPAIGPILFFSGSGSKGKAPARQRKVAGTINRFRPK